MGGPASSHMGPRPDCPRPGSGGVQRKVSSQPGSCLLELFSWPPPACASHTPVWGQTATTQDPVDQACASMAATLGTSRGWGSEPSLPAQQGLPAHTPTWSASGSLRRPLRGQKVTWGGKSLRERLRRAAAESQPWVPYESALAGAPGTGGWGWGGEGSSHAQRNQAVGALGLPPLPLPSCAGLQGIFRGLWGEETGKGGPDHCTGLLESSPHLTQFRNAEAARPANVLQQEEVELAFKRDHVPGRDLWGPPFLGLSI